MMVITGLNIGGAELQMSAVAAGLVRRGHRVTVFSFNGDGPLGARLNEEGVAATVPFRTWRPPASSRLRRALYYGLATLRLWLALHQRRPQLAHFLLPAAYLMGAPAAIVAGVPVRVMSRLSLNFYQRKHPLAGRLERRLHRFMRAVLGNSRKVVAQLRTEEAVPVEKLGLIYNGLAIERFRRDELRQEARTTLGLADDELALVVVANLIPYKGHGDLFDALALAAPELGRPWRLLLVGRDDGIGDTLRAQASARGLAERVSFLGERSDVPFILSASDIGILPSHEEGFANAILEGMAAGLPMIVTDVGGNSEAVVDGETGMVVPPHAPPDLAKAICRLAADPVLRVSFGEAGRQRVAERFTMARCIDAHERLYRALVAGGSPNHLEDIGLT